MKKSTCLLNQLCANISCVCAKGQVFAPFHCMISCLDSRTCMHTNILLNRLTPKHSVVVGLGHGQLLCR